MAGGLVAVAALGAVALGGFIFVRVMAAPPRSRLRDPLARAPAEACSLHLRGVHTRDEALIPELAAARFGFASFERD